jgi:hypothetical protein
MPRGRRPLLHRRRLVPALTHHRSKAFRGHERVRVPARSSDAAAVLDRIPTAIEQSTGTRDERAIGRARHLRFDDPDTVEQRAELPPPARVEQADDPSQMLLGVRQLALVGRRQSEREMRAEQRPPAPGPARQLEEVGCDLPRRPEVATREPQTPLAEHRQRES